MKKLGAMILVSMTLLLLGVSSCASTSKLDLSTLDPSRPIQVAGVFMYMQEEGITSDEFYQKYGKGLRNFSDQLSPDDAEKLLEILCGTVAGNWEFIVERVKAKTGLMLNGDQLMQALEEGDSHNIVSQTWDDVILKKHMGYFYSWSVGAGNFERPGAMIGLVFDGFSEKIELNKLVIETADVDAFDEITNRRQATINF
ncbi:MAG: hypothetical protein LBK00_09515 [Treponema sp.]|nr:hypothetical protein [Treponema sp.]